MNRMTLTLAVPWNNSSYIACNGFHPLYKPLFDNDEPTINLSVIDEFSFSKQLLNEMYLSSIVNDVDDFKKVNIEKWVGDPIAEKFINYININELWLTHNIPGDIELHHTSPLTSCSRPFVLHCESFLPIFMPFAYQGIGFIDDIDKVRTFYKKIFSSEQCLGIYSHLQVTLDQISQFFNDEKIDLKLKLTKIGLSKQTYSHLTSFVKKEFLKEPTFLFTSSAHQNPASFGLRGGFSTLLFLQKYFQNGRKGRFVFRCCKPKESDLTDYGINISLIEQLENEGLILWVNQYLSEIELLNLFQSADFYLLPSVNLHSVSIMQAQAAGAIPIVTDTYGTNLFVQHDQTGKILNGVRKAVWKDDSKYGIPIDNHSLWGKDNISKLAMQIYDEVIDLQDNPKKLESIQKNTRAHAIMNYVGHEFKSQFFDDVASMINIAPKPNKHKLPLLDINDKREQLFNSPTQPLHLLTSKKYRLFSLKGLYWAYTPWVDSSRLTWSPLLDARSGLLRKYSVKVYFNLEQATHDLLPLSDISHRNPIFHISENVRIYAQKYPWLKKPLKRMHFIINSLLIKTERIIAKNINKDN